MFASEKFVATPTGLHLKAQGCCTQLPWDTNPHDPTNPNGVVACTNLCTNPMMNDKRSLYFPRKPQPRWGWLASRPRPKVAEYGNLGLRDSTPLGLSHKDGYSID